MALRRVVHLDDTPYRIAAGCAGGIFCSTLPIFGQTFIGMAAAKILRGSVLASLPWSWLSNPATTLPIWYAGYRLGIWLLPGDHPAIDSAVLAQRLDAFNQAGWGKCWSLMGGTLLEILGPLWLGTTVMGIAAAIPGGVAIHALVRSVQQRRCHRKLRWQSTPPAPLVTQEASS